MFNGNFIAKHDKIIVTNHPFKIRPIANRDKAYLAYFKCDFLKATFCVAFQDTIFGALGLNRFSEMIKTSFSTSQVKISVSSENLKIKSQALIDELIHIEREEI